MHSRFIPLSTVFLATLLTCHAALAASCLIVPEDSAHGAVILNHGKEQALTDRALLSDCSRVVLARGIIHVLYETQNGEGKRQTCKAPNTPCSVDAGTWPSWIELSEVEHKSGPMSKKMDKEVSRLPGIPHGKVFRTESAATLNLAKAGFSRWNVTLIDADKKKPIFNQSGSDPVVQVPNNLLRPNGKYILRIDGGKQKFVGGFDVLGGTEAEDVAKQIRQATNDASVTRRAKKLDELTIFYENNLDYEMELLREELKLQGK